jgi:hypothetical protein
MKIRIKQGEHLWSENGTHIIDDEGFAAIATEDTEVDILPEHYDRVSAIIEKERAFKEALRIQEEQAQAQLEAQLAQQQAAQEAKEALLRNSSKNRRQKYKKQNNKE